MAPPRRPTELVDDAIAEILLRIPSDEPADLFRAALVCKPWYRLLTDPAFLRHYREFHRTPPLLGFLYDPLPIDRVHPPGFVPTTATPPLAWPAFSCWVLDCRHGRVLLGMVPSGDGFVIWNPITGDRQSLRDYEMPFSLYSSTAVLCAMSGCNHLDCHAGPFLVVSVGSLDLAGVMRACVYSSEAAVWSAPVTVDLGARYDVDIKRGALIGDEIYFTLTLGARILKYDLGKHCLSAIDSPDVYDWGAVVMQTKDSLLGLAGVRGSSLHLWSRKVNPKGVARWLLCRVIELEKLFPDPCNRANVIGFAAGVQVIFISTDFGTFTIDLKSGRSRRVSNNGNYDNVVPVMSFYTPDLLAGNCY
ncbi:hypothetical protein ACP70R_015213 [Stipagrostis hirtigluma subsp. patula]